ncbi:cupin domain-containing protein [Streptomyces sp. LUP30]|uniref:cupin domain-containing protein n=1 Tax=Streptomyces sp. LUP30 TaxID=1890285 RepID=UPI000AC09BBD
MLLAFLSPTCGTRLDTDAEQQAGDSFVMKPGYVGVWKTIETVRKIYLTVS